MNKLIYRVKELTKQYSPFIHKYYERFRYRDLHGKPIEQVFTDIYKANYWKDKESVSGGGSNYEQTERVRKELIHILNQFEINSILDAPCGDFYWMNFLKQYLPQYYGVDIVKEIIASNKEKYQSEKIKFEFADITKDELPNAELIIARDVFIHFSYSDIFKALANFKRSNAKYLLTTTFTGTQSNSDVVTGSWHPINLQKAPFNFPAPIFIVNENCTEHNNLFTDKSLGLWELKDLK